MLGRVCVIAILRLGYTGHRYDLFHMNSRLKWIEIGPELAQRANWSARTLAKQCGVSVRALELFFLENMGKTPKAWLAEQRQHKAVQILRNGSSVKATAFGLGYKQGQHFSRDFKDFWGCCPTHFNRLTTAEAPRLRVLV